MSKLAVVVVAYNRIPGMIRLLNSLENAQYNGDTISLIISIDNSGNDEVISEANKFLWTHGEKIVRTFQERQGLRKHILSCGEYLRDYDAIAVFEDDIVVSPAYYNYMKQAVEYYKDNDSVAGISLYTHCLNVNVNLPFIPEPSANDVFFLQFAQSWGQIWMRNQWFEFREWYDKNCDKPIEGTNIPELIAKWPKTSWLKYHIKYCIVQDKYFVYPYESLSTCFSDAGEHSQETNTMFQVPLMSDSKKEYHFGNEGIVTYDAFFERKGMEKSLGLPLNSLCVNLYGNKKNYSDYRYLLTRDDMEFMVLKKYALCMRPHECNVFYDIDGNDIILYDTQSIVFGQQRKKRKGYQTVLYYYNITSKWEMFMEYFVEKLKKRIGIK